VWNRRIHGIIPSYNDSLFYSYYQNNSWSNAEKIPFALSPSLYGSSLNNFGDWIYLFFIAGTSRSDLYFSSKSILTDVKEFQQEKYDNYLEVYPNPFNSETRIKYKLNTPARAEIKLFDILGKEVRTLINEERTPGEYEIHFSAVGLASGVYVCMLQADNKSVFKKLIIIK
jgi:hypothetical protein